MNADTVVPATLVEKIWRQHRIGEWDKGSDILRLDRIVVHERSGGISLKRLYEQGRTLPYPELVFGTIDHVIDTDPGRTDATKFPGGQDFIHTFRDYAFRHGIRVFDIGDPRQGIVHVMSPEQGIALPGCTLVCGDSHTCTIGGLGALAWGIGSTEGEDALATQSLVVKRPKLMRISIEGMLGPSVTAKDIILSIIGRYGTAGGAGFAIEFSGSAVRALSVEARLTLCNMAVELAAWTGIVAPDDSTFDYVYGRPFAPTANLWDEALAHWRMLPTEPGARFDSELSFDAGEICPQVTWGTSPQQVVAVSDVVPEPHEAMSRNALAYMDLVPGTPLEGISIDAAFIGSCTNSRIRDLREAASIVRGRTVAAHVKAICVPGSTQVKEAAEREGLDKVFKDAGFEWREAGCSLCFWVGGDTFGSARRVISSTNRNFEGRQGPGVRSHLASPATVAASALMGAIADPRRLKV